MQRRPVARGMGTDRWSHPGFGGYVINVVQIGLGTHGTFIHNVCGKHHEWDRNIHWILQCVSERQQAKITGIGVEPVGEHVRALQCTAKSAPGVALVCAAMGERNMHAVEVHTLGRRRHDQLLQQVPHAQREAFMKSLHYIRNMSCVGQVHPRLAEHQQWMQEEFGVWVDMDREQTDVWTWAKLTQRLNFKSCEVLIVDAEGQDAAVLRSMLEHCRARQRSGSDEWPSVIQFKTMGHCDKREGVGAEKGVISDMVQEGYVLICYSNYNSYLAHGTALDWGGCTELGRVYQLREVQASHVPVCDRR